MHPFFRLACLSLLAAACDSGESYQINKFGTVVLQSDTTAEAARAASAFFYRYDSAQDQGDCDVVAWTTQCNIWQCTEALYTNPGSYPGLSAGDVTVTGTAETLTFTEGDAGSYDAETPFEGPLWAEGDVLIAHASGSEDFPKIDVAVNAPRPVTVTAPEPVDGMLTIDRTKPLSVTWSAPTQGGLYAAISTRSKTVDDKTVTLPGIDCLFDAAQGAGSIPAEVLQTLPNPASLLNYQFDVLTFGSGRSVVDDASLTVRATTFGLSATATLTSE